MRLVWQLVAVAAVALIGSQGVAAVRGNPWLTLALGLLTAVLAVLVHGWVVRRTEHRPSLDVAREGAAAAIGRGVLIGVAMFGAVIVNIAFPEGYEINGLGSLTGAVGLFGLMAAASVTEELMFRARADAHPPRPARDHSPSQPARGVPGAVSALAPWLRALRRALKESRYHPACGTFPK